MPTWHPTPGGAHGSASTTEDIRMGTTRKTMQTNSLLARDELGKVKKILFNNPPEEHVFGANLSKDQEGAREVTMIWKPHEATVSPGVMRGYETKPAPDFKTINKMAVSSGNTMSREQRQQSAGRTATSAPRATRAASPMDSSYGKPSAHRTAETIRLCGPTEPPMKHVIQGAYQDDWTKTNIVRDAHRVEQPYIPPVATRATMGHTLGAQKYLAPDGGEEAWKMSKFKVVPPRVVDGMGGANLYSSMRGVSMGRGEEKWRQEQQQQQQPMSPRYDGIQDDA